MLFRCSLLASSVGGRRGGLQCHRCSDPTQTAPSVSDSGSSDQPKCKRKTCLPQCQLSLNEIPFKVSRSAVPTTRCDGVCMVCPRGLMRMENINRQNRRTTSTALPGNIEPLDPLAAPQSNVLIGSELGFAWSLAYGGMAREAAVWPGTSRFM